MKILFIIHELNAPSHTWARRMIKYMKEDIVAIITTKYEKPDFNNIPVENIEEKGSIYNLLKNKVRRTFHINYSPHLKTLKTSINKYNPDILFINFANIALYYYPGWKNFKGKVFIHVHGADISWNIRKYSYPFNRIYDDKYKSSVLELSKKAFFITNSKFTQNILYKAGLPADKVNFKYFGTNIKQFKRERKSDTTLLFIGRLVDCKGPDLVIRAYIRARDLGFKGKLIIAGDGPLMTTCYLLKSHSKYNEDIILLGKVNEKQADALYKTADIFIAHHNKGLITNQEEAFGVSIIDAMSYGLPVITAKSGGVTEIVNNEENGFLVEQFDIEEQAKKILHLNNNDELKKQYGKNSIKRIEQIFNREQERKQLYKILSK